MPLTPLSALSPIDGRYHSKLKDHSEFFSEYALLRFRVIVEVEYFITLLNIPLPQLESKVSVDILGKIRDIYVHFNLGSAEEIKKIESTTNHDVKAIEYFLKEKFNSMGLSSVSEFIHFGLTSQDINSVSYSLIIKDYHKTLLLPRCNNFLTELKKLATKWKDIPILAHTHGQPASPTLLGKEFRVFEERLEKQMDILEHLPLSAKFGGATGNMNAHYAAYPSLDWVTIFNNFISSFGITRSQFTTQVDHNDYLAAYFDSAKRICNILLDLSRDCWLYISMDYFNLQINPGETGSSTMPHKVNPIDFENAEGNLEIAVALFNFLSSKLTVSRLQRDLSDSTVMRNIGVPYSHLALALDSLQKGLLKLVPNTAKINHELENNWAVVAEAIQTILRREGYPNPYEELKKLTRTHHKITKEIMEGFIEGLDVAPAIKKELQGITPGNYLGG